MQIDNYIFSGSKIKCNSTPKSLSGNIFLDSAFLIDFCRKKQYTAKANVLCICVSTRWHRNAQLVRNKAGDAVQHCYCAKRYVKRSMFLRRIFDS